MIYSTGKRKSSVAKVWFSKGATETVINEKKLDIYFKTEGLKQKVMLPKHTLKLILQQRTSESLTPDSIKYLTSVKGNSIPQSFYDYVNSLGSEVVTKILAVIESFNFNIQVLGGGVKGQAEAVMYGVSKCIVQLVPETQKILKDLGFLTRDSRIVERKKAGLRKARKKEQYSKR